jgi:hypothetical protein
MTTDGEVYGISYDCPCGKVAYDPTVHGYRDDRTGEIPVGDFCPMLCGNSVPTKTNFAGGKSSAQAVERGWDLTGDSFENLTLLPSIHFVGHWHGFIRDGYLESC